MNALIALAGDGPVLALGRTIVQSLWQVTLVCGVTGLALVALRRCSANVRYLVACAGLSVSLAAPVATFVVVERVAASPNAASFSASRAGDLGPAGAARIPFDHALGPAGSNDARRAGWLDAASPWLVCIWTLGVFLLSLRLLAGWWKATRLPANGAGALREEWRELFERAMSRLGIGRAIRVFESATVSVPAVIGWMRPIVLLPVSALSGLTPKQIEGILAHELAHIRRHDYLVNLVQSAVETLLFYHPAIWWLSARVRREREHCCDDIAVAVVGDAIEYARALTSLEAQRADLMPRLAAAANGGRLMRRISRLRQLAGRPAAQPGWLVPMFILGVIALALGSTTAVRAAYAAGGDSPATMISPPPAAQAQTPQKPPIPPPPPAPPAPPAVPAPPPAPPAPPAPPTTNDRLLTPEQQRALQQAQKAIEQATEALRRELGQMDEKWRRDLERNVADQMKVAQEAVQRAMEQAQMHQPNVNREQIRRAMEQAREAMRKQMEQMRAERGRRLVDEAQIQRALEQARETLRRQMGEMSESLARQHASGEIDRRTQYRIQREVERALERMRRRLDELSKKKLTPVPKEPMPPMPPIASLPTLPSPPVPPPVIR